MITAKVLWSGRSQVIRLPKEFRFDTDEVSIRRHGSAVVLEPIARDWNWLNAVAGPFDDDVVLASEEVIPEHARPDLDLLA